MILHLSIKIIKILHLSIKIIKNLPPPVSYGMSKKLQNLEGPFPTGNSFQNRVNYKKIQLTMSDSHWLLPLR